MKHLKKGDKPGNRDKRRARGGVQTEGNAKNRNVKHAHNKRKGNPPQEGDGGRYVVVITNVENDFAKVHRETLPRFCCLNKKFERGCSPPSGSMEGDAAATALQKRNQCYYTVSARTETRSVEVAVYGKADGNVSTVFNPVIKKHLQEGNRLKKQDGGDSAAEVNRKKTKEEPGSGTILECVKGFTGSGTRFDTLEGMVMALQRKPYFTHPPKFLLNVAGNEGGCILRSAGGKKRQRLEGRESGQKPQPVPSSSGELRQSAVCQSEMVTAAASTSSRIAVKELRNHLKDIPGFVSCWLLYQQHFRLLFVSRAALFKAKQLLDQFEVDGGVRVTIMLSDAAAREFVSQLSEEENAG